jgi:hypothetical protein
MTPHPPVKARWMMHYYNKKKLVKKVFSSCWTCKFGLSDIWKERIKHGQCELGAYMVPKLVA